MINAKMWADDTHKNYRTANFDIASGEEGDPSIDRPLIIQFCANDPEKLLASAKMLEGHCDAVDINLGCPQDIAKKGRYGAFLMDDWDLVFRLINILHTNLSVPVTAKFRVFPTVEKTVEYAKMLERAGAQILTCHGRLKEQRGQYAGLADWSKIKAVKEAVSVPVFANGNILFQSDIEECLRATGADGVMSAEGQLYNAALFAGLSASSPSSTTSTSAPTTTAHPPPEIQHPPHVDLALEYLSIVQSLKTRTAVSAVKGHLFKLMRPALSRETDLRELLGKVKIGGKDADVSYDGGALQPYVDICLEMKKRMERDTIDASGKTIEELTTIDKATGLRVLPHWLAQPYFRPPPPPMPAKKEKVQKPKTEALGGLDPVKAATVPAKRSISETELTADVEKVNEGSVSVVTGIDGGGFESEGAGKNAKPKLELGFIQEGVGVPLVGA
ncbi:tRNA dihydrouridine synthase [Stygiomarasmius scandens]|uniref:tRNA-dihydrouridine(16/17) synthase [NAD(P)(+)] n=1 Tax=Marasmiellus scandens TaxID=2682957 RepID=A0ABR1JEK9_9AGAR